MPSHSSLLLGTKFLAPADVTQVARASRAVVRIAPSALAAVKRARAAVESCLDDGEAHYGINTGFGSLARQRVSTGQLAELQRNLMRSHAAGVGEPLPREIVRAMMVLLAASLARGLSGVRPQVVTLLTQMVSRGVTPIVPSIGSVGASGDLAPLASIGLVMIGEGAATVDAHGPRVMTGATALAKASLRPVRLAAKEGLAIINGTHLMAAMGAMLVEDIERLMHAAMVACAMSIDASRATHAFLDPRVHAAKNQPGQQSVAAALRRLLRGGTIAPSHAKNDPRVQDPYCLRCAPQVLGAAADAMSYVRGCVERELQAVTDNPLVFAGKGRSSRGADVVSGGNFHGMSLAIPLDAATIALAHVAGISERRVFWMLSAFDPESHLPPYMADGAGLSSGLMIAQYTAAACCNEIVHLANPASVANIGTSAGIEDYNSFGPRSAMKARRALELARYVVATELLCAAQGFEFHRPLRSGTGAERGYEVVRSITPPLTRDRPPGPDVEAISCAIAQGKFSHV